MSNPPLLTDLVPRRDSTYLVAFGGGLVVILLLGALYALGLRLAPHTTDGKVAAFDLDSEGSLGCWFSITLLLLAGMETLLIRSLRIALGCSRRESRLWLAVSVLWFTMSMDEGASLHEAFKEMMARVTGTRIIGDGSIYWAVPYSVGLSAGGLFILWIARRCLPSLTCLLAAGASYVIAFLLQMNLILPTSSPVEVWLEESCEMLGDLFILLTLGLYARSVVFELEKLLVSTEKARVEEPGKPGDEDTLPFELDSGKKGPHRTRKFDASDRRF